MKTKPVVGLFTSVEGHLSIAEAVRDIIQDSCDVVMYLERDDIFDLYIPFYKYFPFLFKLPFRISKQKRITQVLNQYFERKYRYKLQYFCRKHKPDMLLSTYFMYNESLSNLAAQRNIPFVNVITDPRTFHPMIIADRAQLNLTFDANSQRLCHQYYPQAHVQPMGWLVRPEFQQPYDQEKVRAELHLRPKVFTVLITAGSEGTNLVTTILPSLLNNAHPVQVLVACGGNKMLYRSIRAISTHRPGNHKQISIQPLPFTKEMYKYMQAANIVVGKAGPNTIFEAAATLTPFFAITHIAGQEDGNLELIRQYHLGYVEENIFRANRLLRRIIRNPKQLDEFQPALKKMAAYNAQSRNALRAALQPLLPV